MPCNTAPPPAPLAGAPFGPMVFTNGGRVPNPEAPPPLPALIAPLDAAPPVPPAPTVSPTVAGRSDATNVCIAIEPDAPPPPPPAATPSAATAPEAPPAPAA